MLRTIENDAHDSLPCADGAVRLDVDFINSDSLALGNKSIEDIFAEVLALDDHLFLVGVPLRIVSCQRVDAVSLLANSGGY